jgi:hypothetical protein
MTMVIENHNRPYGGMSFESVFPNGMPPNQPQFPNAWPVAHSASHSNPAVYSSVGGSQLGLTAIKQDDLVRPAALSLPFANIPASTATLVATGSAYATAGYGDSDMLAMQPGIARTSFEQPSYTAPPIGAFPPANYTSLNYAPPLPPHQPPQDGRRISQT